jgi:hypothetical protein
MSGDCRELARATARCAKAKYRRRDSYDGGKLGVLFGHRLDAYFIADKNGGAQRLRQHVDGTRVQGLE